MFKTMTAAVALATLLLFEPTGTATAQNTVTSNSSSSEKHRQNQEKTFYSEEVLNKSIAEISGMPEAELRSLAHYFAECDNTTAEETHACSTAAAAYLIEFGVKRPIDNWIVAKSGLEQQNQIEAETSHKVRGIDVDQIVKGVKIESALRDTINQRFRDLRSKQRNS